MIPSVQSADSGTTAYSQGLAPLPNRAGARKSRSAGTPFPKFPRKFEASRASVITALSQQCHNNRYREHWTSLTCRVVAFKKIAAQWPLSPEEHTLASATRNGQCCAVIRVTVLLELISIQCIYLISISKSPHVRIFKRGKGILINVLANTPSQNIAMP